MIATRNKGMQELVQAIEQVARHKCDYAPQRPEIRQDHKTVLAQLERIIADHTPAPYPPSWVALNCSKGMRKSRKMMRERLGEAGWVRAHEILKRARRCGPGYRRRPL